MCDKNGDKLTDAVEVVFRQVYPSWLEEDGEPSSQAFRPWRTVDEGCVSTDRGSVTTASKAFELFTAKQPKGFGQTSVGVWGLAIGEIGSAGLSVWADPLKSTADLPANPAHAVIEFADQPHDKWKTIARRLKVNARMRGRLHPAMNA
jgi:hypothetical protein